MTGAPAAPGGVEYWTRRTEELGARAVVNFDHPADRDLEAVTAEHRLVLLPALAALLDGTERVVCDLGCGAGRFTADFAALIGGRAIGVEPVAALRELAARAPGVSYRGLRGDGRLPLCDGEADVVVTVTVLGGLVADGELGKTAAQVAYKSIGKLGQFFSDAGAVHYFAGKDKKGHGHKGKQIQSFKVTFGCHRQEIVTANLDQAGNTGNPESHPNGKANDNKEKENQ